MKMNQLLLVLPLAALLGACGGGNGPEAEAIGEVPESATASPEAYARFAGSVPAEDGAEPFDVGRVVPPTSETAEPVDLR
jgi:hypothetical protein